MSFLSRKDVLSRDDIVAMAAAFTQLGVDKIRLTGGEPLVRPDLVEIVKGIRALPSAPDVVLSTNATRLRHFARDLYDAGVSRLNISIDSLDPARFREITRHGRLDDVIEGIVAAKEAGFDRIRLNAVVMKGYNDHEIPELVGFARDLDVNIAFIEEMPLGMIGHHDRAATMIGNDELKRRLEARWELTPTTETTGGPARYYRMAGSGTRVGFISPHSHNFCDSCNRVRVTADGRLLTCLGHEGSVDLKPALDNADALMQKIREALTTKPERHEFDPAETRVVRFMNMTGG